MSSFALCPVPPCRLDLTACLLTRWIAGMAVHTAEYLLCAASQWSCP